MAVAGVALFVVARRSARRAARPAESEVARGTAVLPFIGNAESQARRLAALVESQLDTTEGVRIAPAGQVPRRPHMLYELREVASFLNVGVLLYGEVDTAGARVRTMLRLATVTDDSTLWNGASTRDTAELPQLAREISAAVVAALRDSSRIGRPGPALAAARARARSRFAAGDHEEAIRLDPGWWQPRHAYAKVLDARGLLSEAVREARRAHELNPLARDVHLQYIELLRKSGRDAEADYEAGQLRRVTRYLESGDRR